MQYAYTVIIEKAENNYGAYVPDIPGCASTGKTIEETKRNIQEAIELHLKGSAKTAIPFQSLTPPPLL